MKSHYYSQHAVALRAELGEAISRDQMREFHKKSALRHGHEMLQQAHARVLGIVYNKIQVDSRRSDYYYGYYSYYHKAELPSKANGKKGNGSSEWEALTAQAQEAATPAAIVASDTADRSASDREEKV